MRKSADSANGQPSLEALGVDAAPCGIEYCTSHEEVQTSLEKLGFAVIENVLTSAELESMRKELARLEQEESFLTGGNEFTPWQRHAIASTNRIYGRAAAIFHRSVIALAEKCAFRASPGFKASLQKRISRPAFSKGLFGRISSEVREACYIAAVKEPGATRLCNLLNKSAHFDQCLTNSRVLAAVTHILNGDQKLSSLNFRAALPGGGLQPLHVDWHEPVKDNQFFACNMLFVLDDFTSENGPTRVVPGSHRWKALPPGSDADLRKQHPQERKILAKAGSVIALNSHTWHGGTANRSSSPRRILQCYFVRRGCRPQLDQASFATPMLLQRLPMPARELLLADSGI